MIQYEIHEHSTYGSGIVWLVEEDEQGNVITIKQLNGNYSNVDGEVFVSYDPTIIDPLAGIKRKAFNDIYGKKDIIYQGEKAVQEKYEARLAQLIN